METLRCAIDAQGIATLTFDAPDAPVNTMTDAWQREMIAAVEQLHRDKERIKGVLLASAKTSFFAGAQLKKLLTLRPEDAAEGYAGIEAIKHAYRRLETLGRPVVALLNGAALGGGWEVALAAHARFALDDAAIRFGMPEVTLGLIPGATGIVKTVRLLGLEAARPYLMEGRLFGPREAMELGLVDGIGATMDDLRELALDWIAAHPDAVQPWDRKEHRIPGGAPTNPKIAAGLAVAPAMLAAKTQGLYPAPQAILETMVEGALVDVDTAFRIESRKLAKVMVGQTAKNMIRAFFFDMNAIRAGHARPAGFASWKPAKVGVLGAGMMGAGIAQALATRGIACVLQDVSIDKARQAATLERITPTADLADLQGCELIIEAVPEQRALKAQVIREAEPLLAPGGVFASNTSTLPIASLAEASRAPQRFIGLHFFSPVQRMKLVEIVRGAQTDDETVARAYDLVLALGKTPIVVNDARGFFTSRVFASYVMEGATLLDEGVPAPLVEHAAVAAGMPVGPLAVLDETSLTLAVQVLEQARADAAAGGGRYDAGPGERLVERMVKEHGRRGRAGGGGFYDYPEGQAKRLWPRLRPLFEKPGVTADPDELKRRLLYRQSIETARCLAEKVLTSVPEANIGSILGIGFPAWTGGAIQFVASEGLARFEHRADALAARHGERFALSDAVRQVLRDALTRQ